MWKLQNIQKFQNFHKISKFSKNFKLKCLKFLKNFEILWKFWIYSSIYCRKTDENDLFVELDNNKQVEYRVKSPKFLLHVIQYYYLNIKISKLAPQDK
jgi:hypothetical protein